MCICVRVCVCLCVSLRVIRAENNTLGSWRGGLVIPTALKKGYTQLFSVSHPHTLHTHVHTFTSSTGCIVTSERRLNIIQSNRHRYTNRAGDYPDDENFMIIWRSMRRVNYMIVEPFGAPCCFVWIHLFYWHPDVFLKAGFRSFCALC